MVAQAKARTDLQGIRVCTPNHNKNLESKKVYNISNCYAEMDFQLKPSISAVTTKGPRSLSFDQATAIYLVDSFHARGNAENIQTQKTCSSSPSPILTTYLPPNISSAHTTTLEYLLLHHTGQASAMIFLSPPIPTKATTRSISRMTTSTPLEKGPPPLPAHHTYKRSR